MNVSILNYTASWHIVEYIVELYVQMKPVGGKKLISKFILIVMKGADSLCPSDSVPLLLNLEGHQN